MGHGRGVVWCGARNSDDYFGRDGGSRTSANDAPSSDYGDDTATDLLAVRDAAAAATRKVGGGWGVEGMHGCSWVQQGERW